MFLCVCVNNFNLQTLNRIYILNIYTLHAYNQISSNISFFSVLTQTHMLIVVRKKTSIKEIIA